MSLIGRLGYLKHYAEKDARIKLQPEDDPLIVALYEAGLSSREIGEKFEVSYKTITNRLAELGVARRHRGWGNKA